MNERRIVQSLHEIAGQAVPDDLDLWPAIRARVAPRHRSRWVHLKPTTRPGWALLVLALCLALGAGAWAVSPIVDRLFRVDSGLNHVGQTGLGQDLALSQTVDGVTVTLEQAYADANRIAIGLTVRGSYVLGYDLAHVTLSDTLDRTFPPNMGDGGEGPIRCSRT